MSEAVSTGGAPSATSANTSGAASAQAPSQSTPQTGSAPQTGAPSASQSQGTEAGAQTAPAPRRLGAADLDAIIEVKVNGQTKEMTLRELQKVRQLEDASQAKMRAAAESQKKADYLAHLAKTDPEKWAEAVGINIDEFAETRLAKKYEMQQMSPEQRELHEYKAREQDRMKLDLQSKSELREQIKELTGEEISDEVAQRIPKEQIVQYLQAKRQEYQQHESAFENEFLGAWKETGLPKSKLAGQMYAIELLNNQKMIAAGKIEGEPLQAAQAAAKVKASYQADMRSMLSQMDAKAILDFIGDDIARKLNDYNVDRVNRANDPLGGNQSTGPGPQPASQPKKVYNEVEWRKAVGLT